MLRANSLLLVFTLLSSISTALATPIKAPCEVILSRNKLTLFADITWNFKDSYGPIRKAYKFICDPSDNKKFNCNGLGLTLNGIEREAKLRDMDFDLITNATAQIEGAIQNSYRITWGEISFSFDIGGKDIHGWFRNTAEGTLHSKCSGPIIQIP